MAIAVQTLLTMSQAQLDELFTKVTSGDIPNGEARGTAIVAPGTTFTSEIATFINFFAWQGKMFGAKASLLVHEISTFGLKAIIAKVYKGPIWIDGNECIVLDYSQTSSVAHWVRDEIRLIASSVCTENPYPDLSGNRIG